MVVYSLSRLDREAGERAAALIPNGPQATILRHLARTRAIWTPVPGGTARSDQPGSMIAYGEDGIEMALPLRLVGILPGSFIRILLAEEATDFSVNGYGVRYYTVGAPPRAETKPAGK